VAELLAPILESQPFVPELLFPIVEILIFGVELLIREVEILSFRVESSSFIAESPLLTVVGGSPSLVLKEIV
jgi:hypothetical protein